MTQQQQIKEMIEKYENIIKIWRDKIVELRGRWLGVKDYMGIYWGINSYENCIQDLTKLQSLPQEADIDKIVDSISHRIDDISWEQKNVGVADFKQVKDIIREILETNLTQNTTVPKDGEMDEYINQIEAMQVELDWYKNKNLENTKQECPKCKAEKEWRCPNCWAIWLHWCVWKHYPWKPTSIAAQWAWCMWCNKYVQIPHICTSISTIQNS